MAQLQAALVVDQVLVAAAQLIRVPAAVAAAELIVVPLLVLEAILLRILQKLLAT